MQERFDLETERLRYSWDKFDTKILRDYLVADVQDPRINIQSIMCRHWLAEKLFGDKYSYLAEHEIRFALVMNWLNQLYKKGITLRQLQALLFAIEQGQDSAAGIEIPPYVLQTYAALSVPNYFLNLFNWAPPDSKEPVPAYLMATFQKIWAEELKQEQAVKISVLEPACGSANDYRFLESFGLVRFLDYKGFDLSFKNIENARRMFPEANFDTDNVLEIHAEDKSFDYCFTHDLLEHLSIEAMELAVEQICRVTRKGIFIGFFNVHEQPQHIVKEVHNYHWNRLSVELMIELFKRHFSEVEVVHVDSFLISQFNCAETQNKNAYILTVS